MKEERKEKEGRWCAYSTEDEVEYIDRFDRREDLLRYIDALKKRVKWDRIDKDAVMQYAMARVAMLHDEDGQ